MRRGGTLRQGLRGCRHLARDCPRNTGLRSLPAAAAAASGGNPFLSSAHDGLAMLASGAPFGLGGAHLPPNGTSEQLHQGLAGLALRQPQNAASLLGRMSPPVHGLQQGMLPDGLPSLPLHPPPPPPLPPGGGFAAASSAVSTATAAAGMCSMEPAAGAASRDTVRKLEGRLKPRVLPARLDSDFSA